MDNGDNANVKHKLKARSKAGYFATSFRDDAKIAWHMDSIEYRVILGARVIR
jgi:hypothetical protein